MPAPYQLILFDFDGTLMDTIADIAYYTNQTLARRGYPAVAVEQVKGAVGWGVSELFKILQPAFLNDMLGLDAAVEEFKGAYRAAPVRRTRPFPHVPEALAGALGNVRKAIVTNKPQDITLRILEELDMLRHFEAVIGTLGDFPPKPDPASCRYLMRLAGVREERTVYVGDSPVDGETSRAAGIDFAWVEYGYQGLDGREPEFRFKSAADWKRLVS